jgi:glucosamine 6-phosphate synthetase-like amidotransferase/phosphosugar isomerase protein
MCGIFGQVATSAINKFNFDSLVKHSEQRGQDSSGLVYLKVDTYHINRADYNVEKLLNKVKPYQSRVALGHSRLITNGLADNQPVIKDNICVIHNGIIINEKEAWSKIKTERKLIIDSELIVAIALEHLNVGGEIKDIPEKLNSICFFTLGLSTTTILSEYIYRLNTKRLIRCYVSVTCQKIRRRSA